MATSITWGTSRLCSGTILFLLDINDLDNNMASHTLIFTDYTKLFREIGNYDNTGNLQVDLENLVKWSEKWPVVYKFRQIPMPAFRS